LRLVTIERHAVDGVIVSHHESDQPGAAQGNALKAIKVHIKPEHELAILRSMRTLETINDKPVAEFWKDDNAKNP
jgi:hypothetical protein